MRAFAHSLLRLAWAPLLSGILLGACACEDELRVESPAGEGRGRFCVERAIDEDARRRGLMGHEGLAEGEGLLIVFPGESEVCIHNEGVAFPIDVLYASSTGEVTAIERELPADDPTLRCHLATELVLELRARAAARMDVGDRLVFSNP